ncbi:MAG: CoA-binding protein [candidate division Zixibacteria bacterium]|nr:CoA-binding protein [candidate division Zixibacteria bacterium]
MVTDKYADSGVIADIVNQSKVIAVVGLSDKPERPSYGVASYLKKAGYKIIPVNPTKDEILGEKSYPDLRAIPEPVDVVDIFRKSDAVGPIIDEAIKIKAKAVWLQQGVINLDAAEKAADAGLKVVMDRCILIEHKNLQAG